MNITKLDINLLKILINHEKVTLEQFAYFLSTSLVNIRKSVVRLKNFLEENDLGELSNNKTVYSLKLKKKTFTSKKEVLYSDMCPTERFYTILWELVLDRRINLSQLAQKFDLNRTSLNLDMRKIKGILKKYDLRINSLPWKGIEVAGNPLNIHVFSCKIIAKFLLKKEYNKLCWDLYGIYVNTEIKNKIDSYIDRIEKKIPNIHDLKIQIIEKLEVVIGVYAYTYIGAVLLYMFIFDDEISKDDISYCDIEKFSPELQERFEELYTSLSEIDIIKKNPEYSTKVRVLAYLVINLDKKFFESTTDDKLVAIEDYIQEKYNLNLSTENKVMLNILFKGFQYKYDFNVISFNNYFLGEKELPERLIEDLKYILDKVDIKILKEDYPYFALYLYQIICEKYEKGLYDKKILVIDSSTNNWIGTGFKHEILKYIPSVIIDVKSICRLSSIKPDNYDYVLFTNFVDKETLVEMFPNIKDRLYLLSYNSYFEVNNFLEYLFFGEKKTSF